MSRTWLCAAVLFAVLAVPAAAQVAPNRDPAAVPAGTYAVEPSHTRVLFAVSHMGFTTWYGEFTHASGALTLPEKGADFSALDVAIPTGTVSTSNATLDGELKSPDWFDAARYPEIRFKTTSVKRTGADTADVTGDLTFHGVTRAVTLKAKFNASGANPMNKKLTVGFEVSGQLKRSDFGVGKYVPLVGDEITLIISAAFEKE
jgi:polyisoprenoid-binding protein YceI